MTRTPHRSSQHPSRILRAAQLLDQGQPQQAKLILIEELRKDPNSIPLNKLMRHASARLGELEQALYYAQKVHKQQPDDADALNLLGNSYAEAGRFEDAERTLLRAVEVAPTQPLNFAALAMICVRQMRYVDALDFANKARVIAPYHPAALRAANAALAQLGHADDAAAIMQDAARNHPGDAMLLSLACASLLYAPKAAPQEIAAAHFAFGRTLAAQMPKQIPSFVNDYSPDRPLRVGMIGADWREHAMRFYCEGLLEHFDKGSMSLHVYMHGPEDDISERMKSYPGVRWTNTMHLAPMDLADRVRQDKIDVLIDTSGHTCLPVLLAMHLRPAPVQASWLAYPCTTGVSAIGWRIADAQTDPESDDKLNVERITRLDPCAMAYRPLADLPAAAEPPSAKDTHATITFGSFSAAPKLNDRVLQCWARVLREVPGSRLVLKNGTLGVEQNKAAILRRLELFGVASGRVEPLPMVRSPREHLETYARVDIALDTFPYPGITTCCEALVMGVPMVSMTGPSAVRRASTPVLSAAGLSDLLCADEDAFVRTAAGLARDHARRAELRRTLRQKLLDSPLGDERGWSARFGAAIRAMWKTHCATRTN